MTRASMTAAQRRVLERLARELSHYGRGVPTYRIHGNTLAALDRRGWITLVPRGSSESYQINERGERVNVEVHQYHDAVITAAGRAALTEVRHA